jgi:hypothetical protein
MNASKNKNVQAKPQTLIGRQTIALGSAVRDKITGLEGVATAVTVWLTGCTRYAVQPRKLEKNKLQEAVWFDQDQLTVTGVGVPRSTG